MNGFRRAFPSILLAAAALACACAIQRSFACPIYTPPQPLRTLYKSSERIVVARVGAREVLQAEGETASVRLTLHVTETVKGPSAQVLQLYRDEYTVADADKDDTEVQVYTASGRLAPQLKRGERYLFFLEPREEGGGYEVNDEAFGVKQLSDEALKLYLERMRELADLSRQEPLDKHALVEWLVRCAEEPATRWEGAYELVESVDSAARIIAAAQEQVEPAPSQARTEEDSPDPDAAADVPEPAAERESESPRFRYTPPDPELATLLNAVQKQRLADSFFASPEPAEGDELLMALVKDFDDPRFPGFVLARLHRFEDEAPVEAEAWVSALAGSLKNKQLKELADAYTQNTTYYEEDEEEQAADAPPRDGMTTEATDTSDEAAPAFVEEASPAAREARLARLQAAGERATRKRSAMLKDLLARLDLYIATGQLASN